ncbi:ErfK/YbiS/YcfS/YnhG family protein [Microbacterium sp. CH12i]|nr:ErfK/YbiS/YcfS/YnhG family protein [Microbacterium sp. CH12i]
MIFALVAMIIGGAVALGVALMTKTDGPRIASATALERPTPSPTPIPTPAGFPENTEIYDLASLPIVDVFSVNNALPIDDDPYGATASLVAVPGVAGAAVFADPQGAPVAYLPQTQQYEGTIVPVIEKQDHWIKVLLVGRSGLPPEANPAQTVGWMRISDVTLSPNDPHIEVSLSQRTIDIVSAGNRERVASDFASGADGTPTPLGRSFIMTTRTSDDSYTRGFPLVYLSAQSPTLADFGGSAAAVTAFHYHDDRSGAISNGCLRVDSDVIERLAQLTPGTTVYISE